MTSVMPLSMKYPMFLSDYIRAIGIAGTAAEVQRVGAKNQRTAGRPRSRNPACATNMLAGDPEPTPQSQKLLLPMQQGPGAK